MKSMIIVAAGFLTALTTGCDDAAGPSDLDRARVLAVRVDPPHILAGETATIDVLVGDAAGTVTVVAPDAVVPMVPVPGLVERDGAAWRVRAPGAEGITAMRAQMGLAETDPVPVPLDIRVTVDGEPLTAVKLAAFGAERSNPAMTGIEITGADTSSGVAVVAPGEVELAGIGVTGSEPLTYAWYSSAGSLSRYTSEQALLAAEEATDGQIVLVVRDDQYGVGWAMTAVRVE